ncbi:hypothetical protein K461DRAFT_274654 [Myriangium duriaei CBS 260.36]|uniref:Uncharacterized protein n=1 Tax=Myriangium duriaei CBS 260.36 TaxID=1168546 RepID=A0A9P4MMX2_9PEZI|nr:hypothetical protein K461DRAFT_274654 [Myriangium duriaei CBS 260.36]
MHLVGVLIAWATRVNVEWTNERRVMEPITCRILTNVCSVCTFLPIKEVEPVYFSL